MCRGGDKAIDTNFKGESLALRIDDHGDDAPDSKEVTNFVMFLDKHLHIL